MSDNGFISKWQRALRDDPRTNELDWKVGMALSTFADQYTDPAKGYVAGQHARAGTARLSATSHVTSRWVPKVLETLASRGYIQQTVESNRRTGTKAEYCLLAQGQPSGCPGESTVDAPGKPLPIPRGNHSRFPGNVQGRAHPVTSVLPQPVRDQADAPAAPPAAMTNEKEKAEEPARRVVNRRVPPASKCISGCWLGPGHYGDCRTKPLTQPGRSNNA